MPGLKCTPSKPYGICIVYTNNNIVYINNILYIIGISLHDSYYLENNGPKSCYPLNLHVELINIGWMKELQ